MNKRAFTLIELLAIMTLLGIMVVLVLPQIGGSIEDRKNTQYNNIVSTIKSAAKVYYSDNDQTSMVSVATLVQNDYLSSGLTNPLTGSSINGCVLIEKDSDGYNAYNYYDNCSDVHEYTMINLITNGSFENGSTDWNYSPSILISNNQKKFGSYSARNLNGGQWSAISKGTYSTPTNLISVISGHIYYVSNWIYLVNAGNGFCYSDLTLIYNSTNNWFANVGNSEGVFNSWKKLSNRVAIPMVTSPKLTMATVAYNQTDNVIDCYADGALLIDLTATFGAGNEPTKEWCDNNINYFDGNKTIYKGPKLTNKVILTVNPNGGTYEGSTSNTTYQIFVDDFQTVNNPTRGGYTFDGWTIQGEGTYSSWLFKSGFTDATLTAKWLLSPTLTVNANGGTWSGTTPQNVVSGNTVTIANPIRTNYAFTGWTVSGAGSSMSGTTFTMGTANTTLTANWTLTTYTLTVNANGGTWGGISPQNLNSNTTVTISNPYRSGYVFNGWTVSGTGSSISGTTFTMGTANTTLTANWLAYASMYTYTGSSTVIDDGSGNWRIKFLTSGTFTPLINMTIDAFLVGGGGGGGGNGNSGLKSIGSGGGGGWTGTGRNLSLNVNQGYYITVGGGGVASGNGGNTYAFDLAVPGGAAGYKLADSYGQPAGGAGGSGGGAGGRTHQWVQGGAGGSDGSNGQTLIASGGAGQGTTTREFGEAGATLYSGGGGGGSYSNSIASGQGGAGGGGRGYGGGGGGPTSGEANTGGGGGGGSSEAAYYGASGGSGIVVIRNHR